MKRSSKVYQKIPSAVVPRRNKPQDSNSQNKSKISFNAKNPKPNQKEQMVVLFCSDSSTTKDTIIITSLLCMLVVMVIGVVFLGVLFSYATVFKVEVETILVRGNNTFNEVEAYLHTPSWWSCLTSWYYEEPNEQELSLLTNDLDQILANMLTGDELISQVGMDTFNKALMSKFYELRENGGDYKKLFTNAKEQLKQCIRQLSQFQKRHTDQIPLKQEMVSNELAQCQLNQLI